VGFELKREKVEKTADGQERVILKLSPSSFVIAMLVKPIRLEFSPDGLTLYRMHGRTLPKRQDGNSFKDLDATLVYTPKP